MTEMQHGFKIKKALAENTAEMKVLADRLLSVIAGAEHGIEQEQAKDQPSQWKIQGYKHLREKAEERLTAFKAGPERLPKFLQPGQDELPK